MSRFIDADIPRKELCDWLHRNYVSTEGGQWDDGVGEIIAECVNEIDKTPTADVAPVIHGHWERSKKNPKWIHCSVCEYEPFDDGGVAEYYNSNIDLGTTDYCPNCGAEMDEVADDE